MPLHFDSDLTVEVDGREGRLVADGSALTLEVPAPVDVLRVARAALPGGADGIRRLGRALAAGGASLAVRGPGGESVVLGASDASPAARLGGRVATGSSDVAIERPLAFVALLPRRRLVLAFLTLAVAVVVATRFRSVR